MFGKLSGNSEIVKDQNGNILSEEYDIMEKLVAQIWSVLKRWGPTQPLTIEPKSTKMIHYNLSSMLWE